jgi:molybdate transport repressor ModE-like protein
MDVQGLRLLREIARLGSISAAADALGYTQSAASRQLGSLERATGHPLADRTATGARLTPAGEIVVRRADVALAELDDIRHELARLAAERPAGVRLRAFSTAVASFVPAAVVDVAGLVDVDVAVSSVHVPDEEAIVGGQADVCVSTRDGDAPGTPGIRVVELRRDPLWVCLPAGHPRAEDERVAIADLRGERWILTAMTLCVDRALVTDACARNGFAPVAAARSDDYATTQGLVAAGAGVAVLPQMALSTLHPGVVVRLPSVPVIRRVVALTAAATTPQVDAVVAALRGAAAAVPEPGTAALAATSR